MPYAVRNKYFYLLMLVSTMSLGTQCDNMPVDILDKCREASRLFDQRGDHFDSNRFEIRISNVKQSMEAYKAILPQTFGDQRGYVVSKIARGYIYIGDGVIPRSEQMRRRHIFEQCLAFLAPEMDFAIQQNDNLVPYIYAKAACWASQYEVSNELVRIQEYQDIISLIYRGIDLKSDYLGGGMQRLLSRMRTDLYQISIARGDTLEAEEAALYALDTDQNSLFIDHPIDGESYCENYLYLAKAYISDPSERNYSRDEAIGFIERAFSEFDVRGNIVENAPEGFSIDTKICVNNLLNLARDHGLDVEVNF